MGYEYNLNFSGGILYLLNTTGINDELSCMAAICVRRCIVQVGEDGTTAGVAADEAGENGLRLIG
jgi:hypothetical protein